MRRRPQILACAIGVFAAGCTFTGLADYDIPQCDPTAPLAQDPCNTLNNGATGCQIFQCDPSTKRCSRRTRDADKDGDPPPECGGHDCDDNNPNRSSIATETCDGVDNDCDGISDNGMLGPRTPATNSVPFSDVSVAPDIAFSSDDGNDTYASYSGGSPTCLHGFSLDSPDESDGGCIFVGPPAGSAPHARQSRMHPVGLSTASSLGIAFVDQASTQCVPTADQLDFANGLSTTAVGGDCGASLPTLASFSQQSEAVIAFYDEPVATRTDPIGGCATVTAASLRVRYVDGPATTTPNVTSSSATLVGTAKSSFSTRAPALVAVPGGSSVLLASPLGANAGLYALTANGTVVPLATSIPDLTNARSVAMAVGADNGTTRIAIVAELGCPPSQSIAIVVAQIDPGGPSLSGAAGSQFTALTLVPSGAAQATQPSVAWVGGRNEWWVTWLDNQQSVNLARVSEGGSKADATLAIKKGSLASVRADSPLDIQDAGVKSASSVFVVGATQSSVDEVDVGCREQ